MNKEIIADVQHVLPRNFVVVEYARAHTLLLNHDYFQQRIMRHIPDYLDRLDMQKDMGVALTLLYEGRVVACFGISFKARTVGHPEEPGAPSGWGRPPTLLALS